MKVWSFAVVFLHLVLTRYTPLSLGFSDVGQQFREKWVCAGVIRSRRQVPVRWHCRETCGSVEPSSAEGYMEVWFLSFFKVLDWLWTTTHDLIVDSSSRMRIRMLLLSGRKLCVIPNYIAYRYRKDRNRQNTLPHTISILKCIWRWPRWKMCKFCYKIYIDKNRYDFRCALQVLVLLNSLMVVGWNVFLKPSVERFTLHNLLTESQRCPWTTGVWAPSLQYMGSSLTVVEGSERKIRHAVDYSSVFRGICQNVMSTPFVDWWVHTHINILWSVTKYTLRSQCMR